MRNKEKALTDKANRKEKQTAILLAALTGGEGSSLPEGEEKTEESQKAEKEEESFWSRQSGVVYEAVLLMLRAVGIVLVFVALFTFVFGAYRNKDISMYPAVRDGDLVMFYRLDKNYIKDDTLVLTYQKEKQVRRVVAIAGDRVDIQDGRLILNGSPQGEPDIHEETLRYDTGVKFPLTVGEGEVFVLGDGRENATDSRVYGCVKVKDTLGKTVVVIRTRRF